MRGRARVSFLATVVVAAMAAAVPAAASAVDWTYDGEPITEAVNVSMSGSVGFKVIGTGFRCQVEAEATLKPGGSGEFTSFEFDEQTCEGFGLFDGCTASEFEVEAGSFHATKSGTIDIDYLAYAFVPGNGCWYTYMYVEYDDTLTATPDDPEQMSSLILSGEGLMVNDSGSVNVESEGLLALSPAGALGIS